MLPAKKGYTIYRVLEPGRHVLLAETRRVNEELKLFPARSRWELSQGDEFYDRDPAPQDSERIPSKRYGYPWDLKRGYLKVEKDTPPWTPPTPPRADIPSWTSIREYHLRGDGGAGEQLARIVAREREALEGVTYGWGDDQIDVLAYGKTLADWERAHTHGGWARLHACYAAVRQALG